MKRLLLPIAFTLSCGAASRPPAVRDGDIIFHTSRSAQSLAIQRATGSPYSHMGVVLYRNGNPYVFEAISKVQYTPLARWIARGDGKHFVVKRPKDSARVLTPEGVERLRIAAKSFQGRSYDLTFEWSDSRIYCSELVWKLYDRALGIHIGELQRIKEFNLTDPAVRSKMRERYGEHIPTEEPVISPVAVFQSPLLESVCER